MAEIFAPQRIEEKLAARLPPAVAKPMERPWSEAEAFAYCTDLTKSHYENFPVGSWLAPKALQPAIHSLYAFMRTADDFSDENRTPGDEAQRMAYLETWDQMLSECQADQVRHPVFIALRVTLDRYPLPVQCMRDLLKAFKMDVTVRRYATYLDVLTYCRYSANPVGRLILTLFGYRDEELYRLSDAICTGLQLANHWQDVAVDLKKDRIYLPQEDLQRYGVTLEALQAHQFTPAFQELMRFEVERTRWLFQHGRGLPERVRGRLRWELRLTWQGGTRILDKIQSANYDVFRRRPVVTKWDWAWLALRAAISAPQSKIQNRKSETDPHSYVNQVARQSGSNFYYSFLTLPKAKRQAITAVYAFCREVDDAVDTPKGESPQQAVQRWREEIARTYESRPSLPLTRSLGQAIERFQLSKAYFDGILDGVAMDLRLNRYPTFDDLSRYCYHVAGEVGLLCMEIFGYRSERLKTYAVKLGTAFQLTNILRDIATDAARGRIYIPQEDLLRFGVPETGLKVGCSSPNFLRLMAFESQRTRQFYQEAEALPTEEERPALRAAEIMSAIYQNLLSRIERSGYDVWARRIRVPTPVKIALALKTWWDCR